MDDDSARALWSAFAAVRPDVPPTYRIVEFGDTPELQTALADLVVTGPKRATTSLLRWYDSGEAVMPVAGDYGVVVDGADRARCIIRTTRVDIRPYESVDEAYAFDEGERDRTLASWRAIHRAFFARECAQDGLEFSEEMDVVCERFELVWPA